MAIHPIDFRYGRAEVQDLFTEEAKLQYMLEVEAALAQAQAKVGDIPKKAAGEISKKANTKIVKLKRVKAIEDVIHHDIMAVVKALAEKCGPSGGFVHLGATSNDIIDTSTALQLKDFMKILESDLKKLKEVLLKQTKTHKKTVCIGRTHGQHAVPTTFGLKFAIWASEVERHIQRVAEIKPRILVGQMTGAVGTQSALGPNAMRVQAETMRILGLNSVLVSNQVIQRDRLAEFLFELALISASLDKFAIEIRNLQRTEIAEVAEGFKKKQVGSSTMPHKRNPILAERISGLSRVVIANASCGLKNIPLWHERDLSNSSCERVIIPESCILSDYILNLSINLLSNLVFNYEAIERNLNFSQGRIMAESVMVKLVEEGLGRQKAHALVRDCAMESFAKNRPMKEFLLKDKTITKYLTEKQIESALDPHKYIGTAEKQVEKALRVLR
ncbi:MAG: adenylosuccinate lyase [Candidatus Altiarchaeota archaeon]